MDGTTGMSTRVSVVIPSLNEEEWIESSVRSALAAGADEIIVTDGGSRDATVGMARTLGARVIEGEGMRSRQMNAGFDASTGDVVCFLHADTLLPIDGCQAMLEAMEGVVEFGGFRLSFREPALRLSVAAFMINTRTALTLTPWGDQAQFFRRHAFDAAGRYAEVPIMEDYDMARRMKFRGRPVLLHTKVKTSGRRFLELGVLRTAIVNWRIIFAWHSGVPPETLRRIYGSR